MNNFSADGMVASVQSAEKSFSNLRVVGITAIANITNSVINSGKQLAKSLLLTPKTDGWKEYELTINAVQTLVNSTGKSVDYINEKLKTLDDYADKTVYSTADMFNNIYKFTNAGVDLDTATTAMIGIANATALAGQGAQQASIAYYNLAQSISMGYLTTIDYKSLNLANIATKEFKEHLAEAAVHYGKLTKAGEGYYELEGKTYSLQALFAEALSKQWATTDVMMSVFEEYGSQTSDIGRRAWDAAQNVRSFSMMMESLKASSGTGWKDTYQIIFGNLEEATQFWSAIYRAISSIIDGLHEIKNTILESAFGRTFTDVIEGTKSVLQPIQNVQSAMESINETYNELVQNIIRGDWGNGQVRFDKLTEAGYNYYRAQNMVNEALDDGYRFSDEMIQAQDELLGTQQGLTTSTSEFVDEAGNVITAYEYFEKVIANASDEELRAMGYNDEQIDQFKELISLSKKLGVSYEDLFERGDQINGRWLITDALKTLGETIKTVSQVISEAFMDVFGNKISNAIFDTIAAFHRFSNSLKMNDETAEKLRNTFKGLFATVDLVLTVINFPIRIALKLLGQLLKVLGFGAGKILDVTSSIGSAIYGFREWINNAFDLTAVFEALAPILIAIGKAVKSAFKALQPVLKSAGEALSNLVKSLSPHITGFINRMADNLSNLSPVLEEVSEHVGELSKRFMESKVIAEATKWINKIVEAIQKLVENIKGLDSLKTLVDYLEQIGGSLFTWFENMKEAENIPKYIFDGLKKGVKGILPKLGNLFKDVGQLIIDTIKDVLGIHSPSKVMIAIGGFIIWGLITGLQSGSSSLLDVLKNMANQIVGFFKGINLGNLITVGLMAGLLYSVKKITALAEKVIAPLESLSYMLDSLSQMFKDYGKAKKMQTIPKIILSIAAVIGVLAAAMYFLGKLKPEEMKQGVIALGIIVGALLAVVLIIILLTNKIKTLELPDTGKILAITLGMAGAMLIMANILKKLSNIKDMNKAIGGLIAITVALGALIGEMAFISGKLKGTKNIEKMALVILAVGASLFLIGSALKKIDKVSWSGLAKAAIVIVGLVGILAAIYAINKFTNKGIDKSTETLKSVAGAITLMVVAAILSAAIKKQSFQNLFAVTQIVVGLVVELVAISKIAGETQMIQVRSTLLFTVLCIGAMALICSLIGNLSLEQLAKGVACVTIFSVLIGGLIVVSKIASSSRGVGLTLFGVTALLIAMAGIVMVLGTMRPEDIEKGLAAVTAFSLLIMGILAVASITPSDNAAKALGAITAMIVAMTISLVALSFLDEDKLKRSATAMTAVVGSMAALIFAVGKMKVEGKTIGTLILVTVVIGILAVILALLSKFSNTKDLLNSAKSLSLLMLSMTAVVAALSKIKINKKNIKNVKNGIIALTAMAIPLLAFSVVLKAMDAMNFNTSLKNVMALIVLTAAMTGLVFVISKIHISIKDALVGVIALTAMALPLIAFVGVLAVMSNVKNATENVMALTKLAAACTLLLIPLTILGAIAVATGGIGIGAIAIGIVSLLAMAVPLRALVGVLEAMDKIQNATTNVDLLIRLMESMTKCLFTISVVAPLAAIASVAMLSFVKCIEAISLFALAVGVLMDKFPQLKEFIDKGLGVLESISFGLGRVFSGFVSGFSAGLADALPYIATRLSEFSTALLPFMDNMSKMDKSVTEGINNITEAIVKLAAAEFISGLSILSSGFSESLSGIKGGAFGFDSKLENLADSIHSFIEAFSDISYDSSKVKATEKGIEIFSKLVEISDKIPNQYGLIAGIVGDNGIEQFAKQLGAVGSGISSLMKNVIENIDINEGKLDQKYVTTLDKGIDIFKQLVEVADKIPNEGLENLNSRSFVSFFVGENRIEDFANQLGAVGSGINSLMKNISENIDINDGQLDQKYVVALDKGIDIFKQLVEVAKKIPNQGVSLLDGVPGISFVNLFTGENDIETFAEQLSSVGSGIHWLMKNLADNLNYNESGTGLNEGFVQALDKGIDIFVKLVEVSEKIPNESYINKLAGTTKLRMFADALDDLGGEINRLMENMTTDFVKVGEGGNIDTSLWTSSAPIIESIVNVFNTIVDSLSNINTNGISDIYDQLTGFSKMYAVIDSLDSVGAELNLFVSNLFKDLDMSKISVDAINPILGVLSSLAEFSDTKADKLSKVINVLTNQSTGLSALGTNLGSFITNLFSNLGDQTINVEVVTAAATVIEKVGSIDSTKAEKISKVYKQIQNNLGPIGEEIGKFINALPKETKPELVESSIQVIEKVANLADKNSDDLSKNVNTISSNLDSLSKNIVTFVTNLKNGINQEDVDFTKNVTKLVKDIIDAIIRAVDGDKGDVKNKFNELGEEAYQGLNWDNDRGRFRYFSFESLGKNFVEGFANGIRDNMSLAGNAGSELGKHALAKAKESIDSNSPSKETYKLGTYFGQGFYGGIMAYRSTVGNAAEDIGTYARDSLRSAVAQAELIASSDMDMSPTIRPVLDLSDIQSGSRSIGSLLSNQTIGLNANLSSISRSMNSRLQNGANSDVVSAIDSLSKNLGSTRGDTYNINGVNYTSDSEVSAAIKTLVGAVVNKRRI